MKFEELKSLLREDRSVRRFDSSVPVSEETLKELVALTRLCASGRNAQPLKYRLVFTEEECRKVFPTLAWAGYYTDWDGPEEGERPVAYLVQCLDTKYGENCLCDDGLQLQAISLGTTALGLGGCIIKAFRAKELAEALAIDSRYSPRYVYALGRPAEKIVLEDMDGDADSSFKYYRDASGGHHVPKRPLGELLLK